MTKQKPFFSHLASPNSWAGALGLFAVSIKPALAQGPSPWTGVCVDERTGVATIQGLQCLIANVLQVAITVIGLIGFLIFIMAAFRYMLSGGESKGVEAAKNAMTYAVVGLVVALSAVIIINLLSAFTGINFGEFIIPDSNRVWN